MKRKLPDNTTDSKKQHIEQNLEPLPLLSAPYNVEIVVRKNKEDMWTSLNTTKHAIQKVDENKVHHILVHSVPDHYFAIKLTNNSASPIAMYITVDGKRTKANGKEHKPHILVGSASYSVKGIQNMYTLSEFKFYKTKVAQASDTSKLNSNDYGQIKVIVHKATFSETCQMENWENSNRNDDINEQVALKETDTKKFGVLATTGPKTVSILGNNVSFYNVSDTIEREIIIRYCDTTGMIISFNEPQWKDVDHLKVELYEKKVDTTPIVINDDDDDEVQEISADQVFTDTFAEKRRQNRKDALQALVQWGPEKVANWLAQDEELAEYKNIFKMNEVDGVGLLSVTEKYLKLDLKIEVLGHRLKIMNKIESLLEQKALD